MKMKSLLLAMVIALSCLAVSAVAFASPGASILYQESNLGGGLWQYDYTFNNTSTAGEYLYKVFLDFSQPVVVTGLPLPGGWFGTSWDGTHTTLYLDAMSTNPANDIAPNASKSGFSFTVDQQIGATPFYAEFDNHQGGFSQTSGTTAAASPVAPEPVSSILFVIGGSVIAARRYIRGRKA